MAATTSMNLGEKMGQVSAIMGLSQTHQAAGAKVNDPRGGTYDTWGVGAGSVPGNSPKSSLG